MSVISHEGVSVHPRHPRARPKRERAPHAKHPKHAKPNEHRHVALFVIVGISLVVVSSLAVGILAWRTHVSTERAAEARAAAVEKGPHIAMVRAERGPGEHDYTISAETRGYFQTTAYAKVSGYVRDVRVDKGDHVKKGQVLGTIDSPETDALVAAAQSDVSLRKQLFDRAKLLAPNVMSLQDLQTATSNLKTSGSSLASALALQSYETIRAPFDGIVTMRYVDPGALMPAATGSTSSAQPFVDIADSTRLRIWAYVGQDEALFIHEGDPVTTAQGTRARVDAKVSRTSGALDPRTRTMLCEIVIDNAKGELLPGAFSEVTFHIHSPASPWVPAEAIVLREGKELVAIVKDDHIHLAPVTTGVTDGKRTQIVSGLEGGEMVALNFPAEIGEGAAVQAKERPAAAPSDSKTGSAPAAQADAGATSTDPSPKAPPEP
jgi:RND family efflux transporter MFP subunit